MKRSDAAAIGLLTLLAVAWAWPIAARISIAIPGSALDHDVATMVWNVGWVQQAIETRQSLLRSDDVLLPFGADLRLHTYGLLPALIVSPIAGWIGVVAAFNVMLIATTVLNGVAGYLLLRDLPVRPAAALIAASALMLSGPVLGQLRVGRPIMASIWITCAALLIARRLIARPTIAGSAAVGGLLVAALFTDFQMLLFTALWLALLAVWAIGHSRSIDLRCIGAWMLAIGILAVPFGAIFYPALAGATAAGYATPSLADMSVYAYRWWDYVTPVVVPHAFGSPEMAVAVCGALLFLRSDRRIRFWLLGAGVLLVLALGPFLRPTRLPLPFAALSLWTPLGQFRTPYRLTIPAMIGVTAVGALFLDWVLGRVTDRRVLVLAVAAALGLRLGIAWVRHPLATQEYPTYDVYRRLANDASTSAIIEVPFGVRSGLARIGSGGEVLQIYQHVHRKRIVNAMVARLPSSLFDFYRAHPSLPWLAGERVETSEPIVSRDLDDVIGLTRAGYLLVHRGMMDAESAQRIVRVLDAHPRLERSVVERDLVVYRVASSHR